MSLGFDPCYKIRGASRYSSRRSFKLHYISVIYSAFLLKHVLQMAEIHSGIENESWGLDKEMGPRDVKIRAPGWKVD